MASLVAPLMAQSRPPAKTAIDPVGYRRIRSGAALRNGRHHDDRTTLRLPDHRQALHPRQAEPAPGAAATGVGFVATLTSILVGAGRTARADPVSGSPPVVDGLSVRIPADNHTDRYSAALATPGMKGAVSTGTKH
jgi:hypothetical protein